MDYYSNKDHQSIIFTNDLTCWLHPSLIHPSFIHQFHDSVGLGFLNGFGCLIQDSGGLPRSYYCPLIN